MNIKNLIVWVVVFFVTQSYTMERSVSEQIPLITRSESSDSLLKYHTFKTQSAPSPLSISECSSQTEEEEPRECIIRVMPSARSTFEEQSQLALRNSECSDKRKLEFSNDNEIKFRKLPKPFKDSFFICASSSKDLLSQLEAQVTSAEGFAAEKISYSKQAENAVRNLVRRIAIARHTATYSEKSEVDEHETNFFSKYVATALFAGCAFGIALPIYFFS